ncbi:MAG: cell division protein ZapA [Gammaproteobacteria bacterium]|nr:cell division protein ZapA [Gammaproteobacteria bacterium]
MSNTMVTVSVSILGRDYQVSCPAEEREALERAARHLDEQMREIRNSGKIVGSERIAVMAALNLSHELLGLDRNRGETERIVQRLGERIDRVLGEVRELRAG